METRLINLLRPDDVTEDDKRALYQIFTTSTSTLFGGKNVSYYFDGTDYSIYPSVIKRKAKEKQDENTKQIPHPISRYQVVRDKIGEGGFGAVLSSPIVIKLDDANKTVVLKVKERAIKRQKTTSNSDNELGHMRKVQDSKQGITETKHDGYSYMFMPRFPGSNLHHIFNQIRKGSSKKLTFLEQAVIAYECLRQTQEVHNKGIVHLDLKPGNFVYNRERNTVKVVDFGISLKPGQMLMRVRTTEGYVPPETLKAKENDELASLEADFSMDAYAMGVTLEEIFAQNLRIESERDTTLPGLNNLIKGMKHPTPNKRTKLEEVLKFFRSNLPQALKEEFEKQINNMTKEINKQRESYSKESDEYNILLTMIIKLNKARYNLSIALRDRTSFQDFVDRYEKSYKEVEEIIHDETNRSLLNTHSSGIKSSLLGLSSKPIRILTGTSFGAKPAEHVEAAYDSLPHPLTQKCL